MRGERAAARVSLSDGSLRILVLLGGCAGIKTEIRQYDWPAGVYKLTWV